MNCYIQKGKEEDWEDAMLLAYRTFQKYVASGYTEEGVKNFVDFISDQHLFRMFMVGEYHLWVAKDEEGTIIGMGSLRSGNHISLLFVDENYLRMGIGTAIIKVMEEYVKEINKDSITVNASPFGIPFYHSIGFEDTGKQTVNGGMTITPMRKLL